MSFENPSTPKLQNQDKGKWAADSDAPLFKQKIKIDRKNILANQTTKIS